MVAKPTKGWPLGVTARAILVNTRSAWIVGPMRTQAEPLNCSTSMLAVVPAFGPRTATTGRPAPLTASDGPLNASAKGKGPPPTSVHEVAPRRSTELPAAERTATKAEPSWLATSSGMVNGWENAIGIAGRGLQLVPESAKVLFLATTSGNPVVVTSTAGNSPMGSAVGFKSCQAPFTKRAT
jgi:hypothetical protein